MTVLIRTLTAVALVALAACATDTELSPRPEPIGDFRLGHNIVLANDVTKGPLSRDATEDELTTALKAEIEKRLRRYDGDGLYHIGARIEAYALGQPGIPVLLSPKSILIVAVNIWDNETKARLNEKPVRLTVFESLGSGPPLIPSGLVNSKEEQLANLTFNAAKQIEELLQENRDAWFAAKAGRARVAYPPQGGSATTPVPPDAN